MKALPFLLLGMVFAAHASETEFKAVSQALCAKMKSCALQQMSGQKDMPLQMRARVEQMLDNSCASMQNAYNPNIENHALYQPAVACMKSLAELPCNKMGSMETDDPTPECKAFKELERRLEKK